MTLCIDGLISSINYLYISHWNRRNKPMMKRPRRHHNHERPWYLMIGLRLVLEWSQHDCLSIVSDIKKCWVVPPPASWGVSSFTVVRPYESCLDHISSTIRPKNTSPWKGGISHIKSRSLRHIPACILKANCTRYASSHILKTRYISLDILHNTSSSNLSISKYLLCQNDSWKFTSILMIWPGLHQYDLVTVIF